MRHYTRFLSDPVGNCVPKINLKKKFLAHLNEYQITSSQIDSLAECIVKDNVDMLQAKIESTCERSLKTPNPHPLYQLKK